MSVSMYASVSVTLYASVSVTLYACVSVSLCVCRRLSSAAAHYSTFPCLLLSLSPLPLAACHMTRLWPFSSGPIMLLCVCVCVLDWTEGWKYFVSHACIVILAGCLRVHVGEEENCLTIDWRSPEVN